MNKRIFNDLAVKSGLAEDMGRGYKFPDNYLEFAEFIVRECMELTHWKDYDMSAEQRIRLSVYQEIKEHFGIKE